MQQDVIFCRAALVGIAQFLSQFLAVCIARINLDQLQKVDDGRALVELIGSRDIVEPRHNVNFAHPCAMGSRRSNGCYRDFGFLCFGFAAKDCVFDFSKNTRILLL